MNLEELLCFHHWLIFEFGRIAWIICSHILNIPITAELFAVTSSTFQAQTSQSPPALLNFRPDQLFVASLWLNSELGRIAWIFCSSWLNPQCEAQVPHTIVCLVHCIAESTLTGAGAVGEQAADHDDSESGGLIRSSWVPVPMSRSASKPEGAAKQQRINLPVLWCDVFQCMCFCLKCWPANRL